MQSIIEIIGKRYTLQILKLIKMKNRPMKFSEIQEILGPAGTINRRLKKLYKLGLVSKVEKPDEVGRPTYYFLTEKGIKLLEMIEHVEEWALQNLPLK
jgi:DNA-binding HxlR family transcriptional regulator